MSSHHLLTVASLTAAILFLSPNPSYAEQGRQPRLRERVAGALQSVAKQVTVRPTFRSEMKRIVQDLKSLDGSDESVAEDTAMRFANKAVEPQGLRERLLKNGARTKLIGHFAKQNSQLLDLADANAKKGLSPEPAIKASVGNFYLGAVVYGPELMGKASGKVPGRAITKVQTMGLKTQKAIETHRKDISDYPEAKRFTTAILNFVNGTKEPEGSEGPQP